MDIISPKFASTGISPLILSY